MTAAQTLGPSEDPLVTLARRAIDCYVRTGEVINPEPSAEIESRHGGVFVSLHRGDGSLRGCLGTIAATRPSLAEEIAGNAVAAASRDPRFLPVSPAELADLHISVDVLGEPEQVRGVHELDPARFGLIVRTEDGRQALLLPDLMGVDTPEQQLRLTCSKGGIHPERDSYRLYRFTVSRHA